MLGDFRGVLVLVQNNQKTPVHALAKRGGERGGDHTLHWLVVGMSLTSRGLGGKGISPLYALNSGFVCKVPGEHCTPAGGQGTKTAAC